MSIADLTCEGQGGAEEESLILLDDCGDCEVRGVQAINSGGCGILVRGNSFMTRLLHNRTAGNRVAGIHLLDNARGRGGD